MDNEVPIFLVYVLLLQLFIANTHYFYCLLYQLSIVDGLTTVCSRVQEGGAC